VGKYFFRLVCSLWLLFAFSGLSLADVSVAAFKLDNGMRVFVQEDHRSPVVVSQVWYRAGALDEVNGKTGVAHVLEHMMFKGTNKVKAGEFSRLIAEAGGKENAFTGMDYTAYFQQLEKSKLPLALQLEADRMQNLIITEEEFAKEIKVVMEERRWRTDDKPHGKVNEQFNALAYRAHPYGRPVIGHMNDLENMTAADAQEWYRNWYAPNNAILVVVGDVHAEAVHQLAKKYFGSLKANTLPVRKPQVEPAQLGERRAIVKAPGKLPYLAMGFHVPGLANFGQKSNVDQETYALEVLAGVLSGNGSARLNQSLVRNQSIALSVGAGYGSLSRGQQTTFELSGTPAEGKTVADLEAAMLAQIELIKAEGVTQKELDRVKAAEIASDVYKRDSMFYQAMLIGQLETMGYSWQLLNGYAEKLNSVTSAQVQAVAKKYLTKDNMTVVTLDPQPIKAGTKPRANPAKH